MKYVYIIYYNNTPYNDIAYKHESAANKAIEGLKRLYPDKQFYLRSFKLNVEGSSVSARV